MHTHYGHTNIRGAAFGAALLAVLLFPSCTAEGPESVSGGEGREFLLSPSVPSFTAGDDAPATKGFVEGTSLYDSEGGNRSLYLTAYLHAQNGNDGEYLSGEAFNTSDGSTWRHDPPVYWPLGGRMDLLAYSSAAPFDEFDVAWGGENCAERMRLSVGHDRTQDDILYGSAWGEGNSFSATSLQMHHTQAWIQVVLKKDSALSDEVVVHSVELLDTYIGGDLVIENNYGHPEISWNFRRFEARDRAVDDLAGVCGTSLPSSERVLNMLVPQQEMKSIRIKYSQGGEEKSAVKELPHATWLAGKRYVYDFTIKKAAGSEEPAGTMEFIDLGLRRTINGKSYKVLFATCNLGATSPEQAGNYYQWGDTQVRYSDIAAYDSDNGDFSFYDDNCIWHTGNSASTGWTRYVPSDKSSFWGGPGAPDDEPTLFETDDAATVALGEGCSIPTPEDIAMLFNGNGTGTEIDKVNNVIYEWTDDYNSTGIGGYIIKRATNPTMFIFLPAAGSLFKRNRDLYGLIGNYWTAVVDFDHPDSAQSLYFENGIIEIGPMGRSAGVTIRPVKYELDTGDNGEWA